jgi:hypothetical protein
VKFNAIGLFRWCAFAISALVSLFFIYNLSISFAIEAIEKIAIVSGAIGLEFFKLFSIISANTYSFVGKQLGVRVKKKAFLYFTYAWVSLYSVTASFGYSIVAVDKMQSSITVLNHSDVITLEKENISNYNDNIKEYKNTKTGYENSKIADINKLANPNLEQAERTSINRDMASLQSKIDDVQNKINNLMDKKASSQSSIDSLSKQDLAVTQTTKRTNWDVISDTIKVPAKTIAFIVLAIFSTSIELGIFTTAPHANKIDNLIVGEIDTISNTKKRRTQNPKKQKILESEEQKEEIVEQSVYAGKSLNTELPAQTSKPLQEVQEPPKETQNIKMESRAEEILETLNTDRPLVSSNAKKILHQI